jgi:hypothetical protein
MQLMHDVLRGTFLALSCGKQGMAWAWAWSGEVGQGNRFPSAGLRSRNLRGCAVLAFQPRCLAIEIRGAAFDTTRNSFKGRSWKRRLHSPGFPSSLWKDSSRSLPKNTWCLLHAMGPGHISRPCERQIYIDIANEHCARPWTKLINLISSSDIMVTCSTAICSPSLPFYSLSSGRAAAVVAGHFEKTLLARLYASVHYTWQAQVAATRLSFYQTRVTSLDVPPTCGFLAYCFVIPS